MILYTFFFFFQAEDGIRDLTVTGVQTCALPILVCANLAEVGRFARLDTWQFRILRACLPGPYTFLLRSEERREGKSVDLGGRRIIKKKKKRKERCTDNKNNQK